jgi:hypothetical protein
MTLEEIRFAHTPPPKEYLLCIHTMQRMAHEETLDASEWQKLNECLLDIRRHRLYLKAA